MKRSFTAAAFAAALSLSAAPLAYAQSANPGEFTPQMGSLSKDSADYQSRWKKPDGFKTNDKGFVVDKSGKPLSVPVSSGHIGYFKPNADNTGLEMSAGGPTVYGENGDKLEKQLPVPGGLDPDSPRAREYAEKQSKLVSSFAERTPGTGEYTAQQRIDASSAQIDANTGGVRNVDKRLTGIEADWSGATGVFGKDSGGANLDAAAAIRGNQEEVSVLNGALYGDGVHKGTVQAVNENTDAIAANRSGIDINTANITDN